MDNELMSIIAIGAAVGCLMVAAIVVSVVEFFTGKEFPPIIYMTIGGVLAFAIMPFLNSIAA